MKDTKKIIEKTHSFILLQHLTDESIVHKTNISNTKKGNKYFVDLLRALADQVEKTGSQVNKK